MANNWIVVANNTAARIFTLVAPAPRLKDDSLPTTGQELSRLEEQEFLENPQGRVKNQALDADRPGRAYQSAGKSRHGVTREVDAKTQEVIRFARQVAARLESARRQGEVERLVLVAAPEFLGLLRQHLSAELRRMIDQELSLDLLPMKAQEIRAHLPETLFGAAAKS